MSETSSQALEQEKKPSSKKSQASATVKGTSATGGVTAIINFLLINFVGDKDAITGYLAVTPILGGAIVWLVSFFWVSYGKDASSIRDLRVLEERAARAKEDMNDEILSKEAREQATRDYENARAARRLI